MSSKPCTRKRDSDFFSDVNLLHSKPDAVVGNGWCKPSLGEVCYLEYFEKYRLSSRNYESLDWQTSRSGSPSSLVARHLDMASIVFIFVLNRGHAVHSRCALEVNCLAAWSRRGGRGRTLLENALGGAGIAVGVHRDSLFGKVSRRGIDWAERRWRNRCPWHGAWWPQRQSWTSGICRSRDAERQLRLGWACGVHFDFCFDEKFEIRSRYKNVIYDVISLNYPPGKLRSKCSIKIKKYDLINKCIPWKRSHR